MDDNLHLGESIFNPERIFDLDTGYAMSQYGFLPTHLENNAELLPILDFNVFTPSFLPDDQPWL